MQPCTTQEAVQVYTTLMHIQKRAVQQINGPQSLGTWLNGVPRTCAETATVSRGTSHATLPVHHLRGY